MNALADLRRDFEQLAVWYEALDEDEKRATVGREFYEDVTRMTRRWTGEIIEQNTTQQHINRHEQ